METISTRRAPRASGALALDSARPHPSVPHQNLLLAAAPNPAAMAGLATRLTLPAEVTLYEAGAALTHYFFPVNGIASIVMEMDGSTVEVGAVGPEGMLGLPALLGVRTTSTRMFTQSVCTLDRIPVETLDEAMEADPALRALLLRYAEAYLEEVSQSVACNRLHTLEERCARWLLLTHDRTGSDEMKLKQRFLSYMLGVHRPAVSLAAGALQKARRHPLQPGNDPHPRPHSARGRRMWLLRTRSRRLRASPVARVAPTGHRDVVRRRSGEYTYVLNRTD